MNNSHAGAGGNAGYSKLYNSWNTGARSVVRGNVTFSYTDGNVASYDGIWDTEILETVSKPGLPV